MYFSNFQHNGRCIFLVFFALICIGKSSLFQLVNIGSFLSI